MPDSAATLLVGVVVGFLVRIFAASEEQLKMFTFQPEVFFFVLLPPIIFEAGYNLERKHFFTNIGAITLFATVGTLISTLVIGYLLFYCAKHNIIPGVDTENPMETMLFGALISSVDPVATLSIMGSPDLKCDQLLYSLVFGESMLNDAIAIGLFKTFLNSYVKNARLLGSDDDAYDIRQPNIASAVFSFVTISFFSICIGITLGLICSFIFRHTRLSTYPNMEMALIFLFCYSCYAIGEALGLSGIMALFFNAVVLKHYNSYNLSPEANITAEHIFRTLSVMSETVVFLYMGMGVFTGKYADWSFKFCIYGVVFCLIGRALNIFPLSFIANRFRSPTTKINFRVQFVLWFAGLRGAISFALSEMIPGQNKDVYTAGTLFICIFTTCFCGGYTEKVLGCAGMKRSREGFHPINVEDPERIPENDFLPNSKFDSSDDESDENDPDRAYDRLIITPIVDLYAREKLTKVKNDVKGAWRKFDNERLKPLFGGHSISSGSGLNNGGLIEVQNIHDRQRRYNNGLSPLYNGDSPVHHFSIPHLRARGNAANQEGNANSEEEGNFI